MTGLTALWGNLMRLLGFACLIVGIVTAAMDKAFGGFMPILWFLLAIFCFVIVVCTEVALLRASTEGKKDR
jgi:uncharacterized membrane protein